MTGIHESFLNILTFCYICFKYVLKKKLHGGKERLVIIDVKALLLVVKKWEESNCPSCREFINSGEVDQIS